MDRGMMLLHCATGLLLALALCASPAQAAKKKPAAKPQTMDEKVARPGSYVWEPERSPTGAVLVVVSLPEQRAHIYRGGKRIGLTTVSTGSPGRDTPPGQFEILQKKVKHRSNLYDDAPMPFMQRLTWDGIALHAGHIPGYPASHGCIRLPRKLAEQLYAITDIGTRVVVADENEYAEVAYPGDAAPVDANSGAYIFPDAPPPPPAEPPRSTVIVMGDGRVMTGSGPPSAQPDEAAADAGTEPAAEANVPGRPAEQRPASTGNPTERGYQPFSSPVSDPGKRIPAAPSKS